jgi:hypothetical protein
MKSSLLTGIALFAILGGGATAIAQQRSAPAGTVTYWMSADTVSGLAAAMGGGAGGRASMLGMMARGGPRPDAFVHNLKLELGSPRRPAGPPAADHFIPAGLNAGPSLPLVSPAPSAPPPTRPNYTPGMGDGGAQGRLLIYWGCGEHVGPGQPFEFDFARLRAGQAPPAMAALAIRPMTPPSAATSATYGDWPNERSRTTIPANGSLVGDHVIHGNYSPDIRFSLAAGQDFLPPIVLTANTRAPSGAVPLAWQPVTGARGYFAMVFGQGGDNTTILWSSSAVQFSQMGAFDYLSPEEVARLVAQRVVLSPQTTQCTVPVEVGARVQSGSLMMTAFGPEANFSWPARPAAAPRTWAPEWTVKLRTRASYMGMLGMDVGAMMRGEIRREPDQPQPPRRRRNPLGGILGGVIGN